MNDEERFQRIKEKEITRLTTPISYPKIGKISLKVAARDCEGNPVELVRGFNGNRFSLEPKQGILSDDEILMYAPESIAASRIRLKRGVGSQSDKSTVNHNLMFSYIFLIVFLFIFAIPMLFFGTMTTIIFLLIIIVSAGVYIYIMHIKDYTDPNYKSAPIKEEPIKKDKLSETDELFVLFESKENIARELIEKKFPSPQLTNSKFNGVLDNCRNVVESQIEIINALTPTEKTKPEIDSRKKLIKKLISKIDDLTNELILSEESNIEEVIDDMDNLISSVKEY